MSSFELYYVYYKKKEAACQDTNVAYIVHIPITFTRSALFEAQTRLPPETPTQTSQESQRPDCSLTSASAWK